MVDYLIFKFGLTGIHIGFAMHNSNQITFHPINLEDSVSVAVGEGKKDESEWAH